MSPFHAARGLTIPIRTWVSRVPQVIFLLCLVAAGAQAQSCKPPKNGDWTAWLNDQEAAGGHTKACHLGVSINGLIGRIEDRGGNQTGVCNPGTAASTWSDAGGLLNAIKPIISDNAAVIASGLAGDHQFTGKADKVIGTTVTAFDGKDQSKNRSPCPNNRSYVCSTTKSWFAIVRKDSNGNCFLLTAYPN